MSGLEPDAMPIPPAADAEKQSITNSNNASSNSSKVEQQSEDIKNHHASTTALERSTTMDSQSPPSKARAIALVVTLTGAAFLNTMGVQAAVIVLPTIGRDLDIPSAREQWIVSAYALTFGCFLLLWGRLADVYGKRLIFIFGSLWLTATTIAVPFCPTEISFDIMRGLQGLGAAANVPTAIGILGVTFAPGKAKNLAFSTYAAGAPLGGVFGNILGGIVAQYVSWRWIFWILAILAAVVTTAGYLVISLHVVHPKTEQVKNSVDWIGGTLVTVALLALMFAVTEGNVVGWSTPWVPVLIVVSILLLAVFVFWQHHLENKTTRPPLMKVSIFKNKRVSAAMVVMALFFAVFNNYLVFATYFYQSYLGLPPIQTTLRFLPTGLVGILTIFITSRILSKIAVNHILLFGLSCVTISVLLFAVPIPPSTSYFAYGFIAMCLSVFGADTLYPSLMLFTSHSLPRENQALGGALINAVAQVARAIGLAVGTAVQVAVQAADEGVAVSEAQGEAVRGNEAYLKGLRAAEYLNVAMGLTALVVIAVFMRGAGILGKAKT